MSTSVPSTNERHAPSFIARFRGRDWDMRAFRRASSPRGRLRASLCTISRRDGTCLWVTTFRHENLRVRLRWVMHVTGPFPQAVWGMHQRSSMPGDRPRQAVSLGRVRLLQDLANKLVIAQALRLRSRAPFDGTPSTSRPFPRLSDRPLQPSARNGAGIHENGASHGI